MDLQSHYAVRTLTRRKSVRKAGLAFSALLLFLMLARCSQLRKRSNFRQTKRLYPRVSSLRFLSSAVCSLAASCLFQSITSGDWRCAMFRAFCRWENFTTTGWQSEKSRRRGRRWICYYRVTLNAGYKIVGWHEVLECGKVGRFTFQSICEKDRSAL